MLLRNRNLNPDIVLRLGLIAVVLGVVSSAFLRDPSALPDFVRGLIIGLLYGIGGAAIIWSTVLRARRARGGDPCAR